MTGWSTAFPELIVVHGNHSSMRYTQNLQKAVECEFWDGEMMEYICMDTQYRLILTHFMD
jgi:hypothetical protein